MVRFRKKKKGKKKKYCILIETYQYVEIRIGFVTTTRVTHATPAGLYAHVNNRDWECDTSIPKQYKDCVKDIGRQLVEDEPGNKFQASVNLRSSYVYLRTNRAD